jgi:glycosyltransferase involved in cell wall biosynthesis
MSNMASGLAIIETHPIQYHAPVYRTLQERFGIPVTVIYGSDFSIAGYHDPEFEASFAWDTDLLAGYTSFFLSHVAAGGARSADQVSARGLGAILQRVAPAAVLLVGYSPRFHQQAFWSAWRAGYPILFRGETTDHARSRGMLKQLVRDRLLARLYQQCARLLYVGKRSLAHYQRLGCAEHQLIFSPYCVDTSAFHLAESDREHLRTMTRRELELSNDNLVLLFSGKLVPRKAPDLILRAVKRLPQEMRERTAILFLGAGSMQEALMALARVDPAVAVRFLGFQNQHALSCYYHAADLLVLPSQTDETWGLVVNEALHHGVPCVVSGKVGCAPDLIEPGITGMIFAGDTEQGLTVAIQESQRIGGSIETRQHCRRQVARYTTERAAEGIAQAYWSVVQPHHLRENVL